LKYIPKIKAIRDGENAGEKRKRERQTQKVSQDEKE